MLRRLYKDPAAMDLKLVLDFLVCFAINNPDTSSFEAKNSNFVEACLDLVEQTFTGAKTTTVLRIKPQAYSARQALPEPETRRFRVTDPDVEKFEMYYFQTIFKTGDVFKKSMQTVLPQDDHLSLQTSMVKYR